MTAIIQVEELRKVFRTPLQQKRVEVLKGISFTVERGEVFGFLGPNGAGKTTTIRILMGLISASSGKALLFDEPVPSRKARMRLGFLPEAPYFYEYLTVGEMLDLCGRLFGLDRHERKKRANELIDRVGLGRARSTPLKKYSKGMLQRAGVAQALINDPELVVLDEPTSGLDPVGRREMREIMESLRDQGKTVFFSSHILADVEALSDRVGIVVRGTMPEVGTVSELVGNHLKSTDVVLRIAAGAGDAGQTSEAELARLAEGATSSRRRGDELWLSLPPEADVDDFLARSRQLGTRVVSVTPRRETLEDLFMRHAQGAGSSEAAASTAGQAAAGEAARESV